MNQKYKPISFRTLGEKLPNPQTTANAILRTGGGGGNTKRLADYIRLACATACKSDVDRAINSFRANANTIAKSPPTVEEIEQGVSRIKTFKTLCKSYGLKHASTEYTLTLPLNNIVRISGRIDQTLIDEEGNYWFILFKETPSKDYVKEYMYPFIQYSAQQTLHYLLNGSKPKVGIYEHSTPSFTTFNYTDTQEEQLIQDVANWAEIIAEIVERNSGNSSQQDIF